MNKRGISLLLIIILIFGIVAVIFSIFVLYNNYFSLNTKSGNIYPAPEGYSLLSDFFKNDATAISIINGGSYTLSDNSLYITSGNDDFSSFEFKLINAFKQMGYTGLTNYNDPEDSASTYSLHRFEERNQLPISDILDGRTLALIDAKLFDIETKDKIDSAKYPPLIKFIESPLNEPPNEHLASLYYRFYQALPTNMPVDNFSMARTIDEFQTSLTVGMGGNLGSMLDASGTKILIPSEMIGVWNNKTDFKFCASSYYLAFNSKIGGNCINPPTSLNYGGAVSDYDYFNTFIHEFGHGVGNQLITIDGITDRIDYQFGKISFRGNFSCIFEICSPNSIYWLRQDDNYDEFITEYSRNGYTFLRGFAQGTLSPSEDFAESFAFYIIQGDIFRKRAENNIYLKQKYDFLKEYVFNGIEYNTGNLDYYDSWLSENPDATPEQKLSDLMGKLRGGSDSDIGIWSEDYPTF